MAVVHQCRREPEATLEWAEATIAAAQQLGYVYREAMGRVLRGWALALLGEQEQGIREITGGLAASRGTGARMDDPHYLALLGEAQLRAGAIDAGLAAVAEALELSRRERSLFYEPELLRLEGGLRAARPATPRRPRRRSGTGSHGRASRAPRRSSCGSAPTWRGCCPTRSRPPRRAPDVRAAYARVRRGASARATCARRPR